MHSIVSTTLVFILSSPASGDNLYLDPGSGSFLLQLIIASALGAMFMIRASWGKIKLFFQRLFSKTDEDIINSAQDRQDDR